MKTNCDNCGERIVEHPSGAHLDLHELKDGEEVFIGKVHQRGAENAYVAFCSIECLCSFFEEVRGEITWD